MVKNIITTQGDILLTECHYMVHGVAELSIEDMGTGLAQSINSRWPDTTKRFKTFRSSNRYVGGSMWIDLENHPQIIYLAAQEDLYKANIHYLNKALRNLRKYLDKQDTTTIAIPRIGCGYGKLEWKVVEPMIDKHLAGMKHTVFIYDQFTDGQRSSEEIKFLANKHLPKQKHQVTIIASEDAWIDGKATAQLHSVAKLPETIKAVGMPDIHASRSIPVGFALVTSSLVYPHLVGNDIGCGMGLWRTDLDSRQVKLDKWVRKLTGLDLPWDGNRTNWLERESALPTPLDNSLGTIGGGNHFAELQCVEETADADACEKLGINKKKLVLLVHSGSRGYGELVLKKYREIAFHGLKTDSTQAHDYLSDHNNAVNWAKANRSLISYRFLKCLGASGERVIDVEHNSVEQQTSVSSNNWIHRKGASPSNRGPVVIPGSRGSFSYLVQPIGNQDTNANSLPHGAGRKWSRSDCKDRLRHKYTLESLTRTELGSRVVCDNKSLLYQEAPQAYKDIEVIIRGLVDIGLIKVLAKLRPVITYKVKR